MAIIIHELEHRYEDGSAGEKVALHDVNIKIEQGEMIGLIIPVPENQRLSNI